MTVIQPLYTRQFQLIRLHPCPEGCPTEDYLAALGEAVTLEEDHDMKVYGWKDALQSLSSVMMNVMAVMDEDIMANVKHVMKQAARENLPILFRCYESDEKLLSPNSIMSLLNYLKPEKVSLWTPGKWIHSETRIEIIKPYLPNCSGLSNYYEQDQNNWKFVSELTDKHYILGIQSYTWNYFLSWILTKLSQLTDQHPCNFIPNP